MNDDKLLIPKKDIVSLDQAREEKERAKRRPPGSQMNDLVSRAEMMEAVAKGSLALGEKMYQQMVEETGQYLREMETALRAEMQREFERRSVRGRLRALREGVRGYLIELGIASPVDPPVLVASPPLEVAGSATDGP